MKTATHVMSVTWSPARVADYVQLARPRIAVMVLVTVFLGGLLASVGAAPVNVIITAVLSTGLVTASASALNQYLERDTDARMTRTASRPLPAGRLLPAEVLVFGVLLAVAGLTWQWMTLPPVATALTIFTLASYLGVYTPAKQRTTLNTLIGAVPGALPPVIGWVAVRGQVDAGAVALFLIVFFWQVPHFLAIAWMYREEYSRAGHKMLTVNDPTGDLTARQMLVYMLALVPVSLLSVPSLHVGWGYAIGSIALAAYWLRPVLEFRRAKSVSAARRVLRASIVYLPGLLGLLVLSKYVPGF